MDTLTKRPQRRDEKRRNFPAQTHPGSKMVRSLGPGRDSTLELGIIESVGPDPVWTKPDQSWVRRLSASGDSWSLSLSIYLLTRALHHVRHTRIHWKFGDTISVYSHSVRICCHPPRCWSVSPMKLGGTCNRAEKSIFRYVAMAVAWCIYVWSQIW